MGDNRASALTRAPMDNRPFLRTGIPIVRVRDSPKTKKLEISNFLKAEIRND